MESSTKFAFWVALVTALACTANCGLLDSIFPTIMTEFYQFAPTQEGYHFSLKEPNGSDREEMAVIMNPGTPEEQVVVMGTYSTYDEKTDTESVTMYTADKDGYKTRYMFKNRKISAGGLKTGAG